MEAIFRALVFDALVGIVFGALAFVATLLIDKWYPSGRFMGHPEAIFRSVVFGSLAFVATLLVDNWYLGAPGNEFRTQNRLQLAFVCTSQPVGYGVGRGRTRRGWVGQLLFPDVVSELVDHANHLRVTDAEHRPYDLPAERLARFTRRAVFSIAPADLVCVRQRRERCRKSASLRVPPAAPETRKKPGFPGFLVCNVP